MTLVTLELFFFCHATLSLVSLSLICLLFTQPLVTGFFVQITVLTAVSQERHRLHINYWTDVSRPLVIAERPNDSHGVR